MTKKAAFLDRDGVINRRAKGGEYITRWDEFEILPGVPQGLALLNKQGFVVVVITNQRCVAKKLIEPEDLEKLHNRMCEQLATLGGAIANVYFCPHDLEAACDCRKPAPGMLVRAAQERNLDLSASWMIGDSEIDIVAGKRAGCKTARLLESGMSDESAADLKGGSLLEIAEQILKSDLLQK